MLRILSGRENRDALLLLAAAVAQLLPDPGVANSARPSGVISAEVDAVLSEARQQLGVTPADQSSQSITRVLDFLANEMRHHAFMGADLERIAERAALGKLHEAKHQRLSPTHLAGEQARVQANPDHDPGSGALRQSQHLEHSGEASTGYANEAALVPTDWVADHLNDPSVRLIEVDVDTTAYDQGHIPGAVGFNWSTQLIDQIRHDIPPKLQWEQLLSQAGVWPDMKIVFYGDNNNWFAAYAYWVARLYGHTDVALMNGGRKKWEAEARPLTTDAPSVKPTKYQAKDIDLTFRAYQKDVQEYVGATGGKALVDVRSSTEFTGEIIASPGLPETAQRFGHIPGASNIPWAQAVNDDGTFKSADELRALYGGKGITADKDIVAYSRIGERSSHTWFVLSQLLGYPKVRNYDGSWTEWGSVIGVPIERQRPTEA